jgi:hypothetical protein
VDLEEWQEGYGSSHHACVKSLEELAKTWEEIKLI